MARQRTLTLLVVVLIVIGKAAPALAIPMTGPNSPGATAGDWESQCTMVMPADAHATATDHSGHRVTTGQGTHSCCGDNAHLCDAHCAPLLSNAESLNLVSPLTASLFPSALMAPSLRTLQPPRRPPRS